MRICSVGYEGGLTERTPTRACFSFKLSGVLGRTQIPPFLEEEGEAEVMSSFLFLWSGLPLSTEGAEGPLVPSCLQGGRER